MIEAQGTEKGRRLILRAEYPPEAESTKLTVACSRGCCVPNKSVKQFWTIKRLPTMNTIKSYLLRAIATLILVAIPLASCSRADDAINSSQPIIAPEPTGEIDILPTPTPAEMPPVETNPVDAVSTVDAEENIPAEPTTEVATPDAASTETVVTEVTEDHSEWDQATYGDSWTIGYPAGWHIHDAGAHAGSLMLQGDYNGHNYTVTYDYPIGIFADSMDAWIGEILLPLTLEQREAIVMSDITVADTPAKKILNMPTYDGSTISHHAYIWRTETKNWRRITITQSDDQSVDAVAMDQLLDRLLLTVQ